MALDQGVETFATTLRRELRELANRARGLRDRGHDARASRLERRRATIVELLGAIILSRRIAEIRIERAVR